MVLLIIYPTRYFVKRGNKRGQEGQNQEKIGTYGKKIVIKKQKSSLLIGNGML